MTILRIDDAISAIEHGEIVVVVDDRDRENEGDLVVASEKISLEAIAFMMKHARGPDLRIYGGGAARRA